MPPPGAAAAMIQAAWSDPAMARAAITGRMRVSLSVLPSVAALPPPRTPLRLDARSGFIYRRVWRPDVVAPTGMTAWSVRESNSPPRSNVGGWSATLEPPTSWVRSQRSQIPSPGWVSSSSTCRSLRSAGNSSAPSRPRASRWHGRGWATRTWRTRSRAD